ncbi:alpha/beta fold hydrolase [Streptomyces sp. NPDC006645]|uniref:thioesterase II family protein n=1 Tax=unclassified Streptomyces TaxID=2593676 RepID=UPI0033AF40BF
MTAPCLVRPPVADAALRLVCFHHAGGAASAYRGLQEKLGPDIDVMPVQLPGREKRVRTPAVRSMDVLVDELDAQLGPFLDGPYVLYGHSMGALIAHDLTLLRQERGSRPPERLIAGACAAPGRAGVAGLGALAELADRELLELMLAGGGTSAALLNHPEWMKWALGLLRNDLRLCGSRPERPGGALLSCPVDVFAGLDDSLVPVEEAEQWADRTTGAFRAHWFPGGHFFTRESEAAFLGRLRDVLDTVRVPVSMGAFVGGRV